MPVPAPGSEILADAALSTARRQFEGAFRQAPIGMALVDRQGHFVQANQALAGFLRCEEDAIVGRHVSAVSHPEDLEQHLRVLCDVRDGRRREVQYDGRFVTADGESRWGTISVAVIHDAQGDALHYVAHVLDVTARVSSEQQLAAYTGVVRQRTRQDPVTGLPARPQLAADVQARLAAHEPFALLVLSAPGLPDVRERRGRLAGDQLMRMLAAEVTGATRAADAVFRAGPAALALVMTGTPRGDATQAADRIRRRVQDREPGLRAVMDVLQLPEDAARLEPVLHLAAPGDHIAAQELSPPAKDAPTAAAGALLPSTAERVTAMLAAVREQLGMDVAWLSEFTDGQQVFRALEGDPGSFGLTEGLGLELSGSFCLRVLDGRLPAAIADTARNPVTRDLPITADAGLGSYLGAPVRLADGHVYGMLCAAGHDARPSLDERDVAVVELLARLIAERIDDERNQAARRRLAVEDAGVSALLAALDARDHYTGDHSEAVVVLAGAVAQRLGLSPTAVQEVEQVALVHDIGKVGIPDSVLHKPGPLNELEWELMREHSALGGRILASVASLAHLAPAVRAEHERWDGGGYPDRLAGAAIPIASRIILAADAYHAMTSDRPYRAAMEPAAAVVELRTCAGTQFDPDVVAALIAVTTGAEH